MWGPLFLFAVGHNRLNAHMHRKLKIVPPPPSMFFRDVTDTNQSESHSGLQQPRFTRNYMGAWRTWIRPPTSSLLLDWSCKRTRRRKRLYEISMLRIPLACFDFTMLTFLILSQAMLHHVERNRERIREES